MSKLINDYNVIVSNEDEVGILFEIKNFKETPFLKMNGYVKNEKLFISDNKKLHTHCFNDFDAETLKKIKENKTFEIALLNPVGKIVKSYQFSVKLL